MCGSTFITTCGQPPIDTTAFPLGSTVADNNNVPFLDAIEGPVWKVSTPAHACELKRRKQLHTQDAQSQHMATPGVTPVPLIHTHCSQQSRLGDETRMKTDRDENRHRTWWLGSAYQAVWSVINFKGGGCLVSAKNDDMELITHVAIKKTITYKDTTLTAQDVKAAIFEQFANRIQFHDVEYSFRNVVKPLGSKPNTWS